MTEQLSFFNSEEERELKINEELTADDISKIAKEQGVKEEIMTPTKSFAWHNLVGSEREFYDIEGYDKLTDYAQKIVRYLIKGDPRIPGGRTYYRKIDGFIHAKDLASYMGWRDTRPLRQHLAEIDIKTSLVVYTSQHGVKLCADNEDIDDAVDFALAPIKTALDRIVAKSKNKDLMFLHNIITERHKKHDNKTQGQQYVDENLEQKEVNHFVSEERE